MITAKTPKCGWTRCTLAAALALAAAALALLALAPPASAAHRIVDEIGKPQLGGKAGEFRFDNHGGTAVNHAGAGGVAPGSLYVVETANHRVQQFTPAGVFVRAWGMGVLTDDPGSFDICEDEGQCQKGLAVGTPSHPGAMQSAQGIAIDQATGHVYVTDFTFRRIEVFSATGQPQGAFGWGVRDGSAELQFCTVASGCQAALEGGGRGGPLSVALGAGGVAVSPSAEIYVAGTGNRRVDVYARALSGANVSGASFRRAFGWDVVFTGPGDSGSDEQSRLTVRASGGTYQLQVRAQLPDSPPPGSAFTTGSIPFDAPPSGPGSVQEALNGVLAGVGGSVVVTGGPGDETGSSPYAITFGGTLAGDDVILQAFHSLSGGAPSSGATVETIVEGGAFEVCVAADGDACRRAPEATGATEPGHFNGQPGTNDPRQLAFDPTSGDLFVLDGAGGGDPPRIHRFDAADTPLDGAFGAPAICETFGANCEVVEIAADPDSGHLLAAGRGDATSGQIRVLELDGAGGGFDLHGPEIPVTSTLGLAAASLASGGNLYVATDSAGTLVGVYVLNEPPIITELDCSDTSAKLVGEVPSAGEVVGYHLEYSTDGKSWTKVPATDILVGPAPGYIEVEEEATGLTGSQLYRFRLVATKGGASRFSEVEECETGPAVPAVSAAGAFADERTAILQARVNPQNEPTSYHFQYTTEEEFEESEWASAISAPEPDGKIAAGNSPVFVAQEIEGLLPGTDYRARLFAENDTGSATGAEQAFSTLPDEQPPPPPPGPPCPNEALRGGPSAGLPDCRAYELISPPGASGVDERFNNFVSADGSRVVFRSRVAFGGAQQSTTNNYLFARGAAGWLTTPLSPPFTNPSTEPLIDLFAAMQGFSEDFSRVYFVTQSGVDPEDKDLGPGPAEGSDLYLRRPDGSYEWVSREPVGQALAGTSADGTHAVLLDISTGGDGNLYEWIDGEPPLVRVVNVLPGGGVAAEARAGNWSGTSDGDGTSLGAVSADGRRIFFESDTGGGGDADAATTRLWVREDGEVTRPIGKEGENLGIFAGASRDGSRVFFTTSAALVGGDANGVADLYRYELDADTYTRLSADSLGADPDPRVRRQRGAVVSRDGSRVYFVAKGALTAAPNANGQSATEGADNIYLNEGGEIRFVASPQTDGGSTAVALPVSGAAGSVAGTGTPAEWDVSTDGTHLAFATEDALLPGVDRDLRADVYLYEVATQRLSLATTGPRGGNGDFDAEMSSAGASVVARTPRSLGTGPAGSFLFFETAEQLVNRDVNEAIDVYERDLESGRTWLISSGASALDAKLIGASEDGANVVFVDPRQLAPQDPDGEHSLYTARIGGGFPARVSPSCVGEACKGPPSVALAAKPPASAVLRGTGNLRLRPSCARLARRAKRLSIRAKRARRAAQRAKSEEKARRMKRKARKMAKRAKRGSRRAKRCRARRHKAPAGKRGSR